MDGAQASSASQAWFADAADFDFVAASSAVVVAVQAFLDFAASPVVVSSASLGTFAVLQAEGSVASLQRVDVVGSSATPLQTEQDSFHNAPSTGSAHLDVE